MTGATCTVRFIVTVGLPLFEVQPAVSKAVVINRAMSVFMGTSLFECEQDRNMMPADEKTSSQSPCRRHAARKKNGTSGEKSAQFAALKFDRMIF